ncbi:hypothetical protein ACP70R_014620 [Stipagrostis hirtigluma subsp. patula]
MASPAPPAATVVLPEEIVEDILLRTPPDDPASLVRGAAVCKPWCRFLSGRGFLLRYRALHRTPPMLGFVGNTGEEGDEEGSVARFVPTSSFRPLRADRRGLRALEARHGRVLLHSMPWGPEPSAKVLAVWDPITDEQVELPKLPGRLDTYWLVWNAAVLCAAAVGGSCDHLGCHRGPFLVVFVATGVNETLTCVYSSEAGRWSEPTITEPIYSSLATTPGVLVENALYFMLHLWTAVLKYDLTTREISVIRLPPTINLLHSVLMTMEGGGLGIARVGDSILYQWSREEGHNENDGWTQSKVIDLETLLPVDAFKTSVHVDCFADGTSVIFVKTADGLYSIDLKSIQVKKLEVGVGTGFFNIVPYMSFYKPALGVASTGDGPQVGISNA